MCTHVADDNLAVSRGGLQNDGAALVAVVQLRVDALH